MLALSALLSSGCAYTVRLLADPETARVRLPDGSTVLTPTEVTFPWAPGKRQTIFVEADGYRTLIVDMQRAMGPATVFVGNALFQRGGRELLFLLEPLHPPAGGTDEMIR